jgi:competence protein ComEC
MLGVTLRSLPDGRLHVHFLDVGQGEAVLIVTPDGQQVLVDGGASPTALLGELGRLMPFYDRAIELVLVTHAGDERLAGLLGLAQRYRIGQVVQAPFPYPSAAYGQWLRELDASAVPIVPAEAGMRLRLGYGIALDVLNPGAEPFLAKDGELDLKANSLVLRLSWGRTNVLLLGDAPRAVQEWVVEGGGWRVESGGRRVEGEETLVKVPDGGRQATFSEKLLQAVQPQHAVVFAEQDDRFRDLAAGVEEAWKAQVGAAGWHRTDLEGTISVVSDGTTLRIGD